MRIIVLNYIYTTELTDLCHHFEAIKISTKKINEFSDYLGPFKLLINIIHLVRGHTLVFWKTYFLIILFKGHFLLLLLFGKLPAIITDTLEMIRSQNYQLLPYIYFMWVVVFLSKAIYNNDIHISKGQRKWRDSYAHTSKSVYPCPACSEKEMSLNVNHLTLSCCLSDSGCFLGNQIKEFNRQAWKFRKGKIKFLEIVKNILLIKSLFCRNLETCNITFKVKRFVALVLLSWPWILIAGRINCAQYLEAAAHKSGQRRRTMNEVKMSSHTPPV